jgi:hypothetical protein
MRRGPKSVHCGRGHAALRAIAGKRALYEPRLDQLFDMKHGVLSSLIRHISVVSYCPACGMRQ